MQNIFTKHLSLVNHFNKLVLTNRTINVLTLPICAGIKQEAKDLLSKLNIPEKPKRPLSAYMQYLFEKRPQVKVNYPNLSNIELIKKMSEDWKNLSSDLKLNYENKAKQNKEEYDKRLLQFNNNLTPEQKTVLNQIQSELREEAKKRKLKREIKQHNKPKKPASAYSLFLLSYAKEQGLNIAHAMQSGKGKWDALSEQEKEKYYKEYSEKKKMFEEELAVWEAKMIAEGREKLIRGKTLKAFDKFNEKSPVVKKSA
ncbi:transcription factor A, mitochondrial-like [Rhynchophorus ferrugineus]|uniref:transcription factor A, mitochondrial-like n=1 Tax=Rhynchophorus ferrugineus TaxID=354439 RepID=UPI003FCC35C4